MLRKKRWAVFLAVTLTIFLMILLIPVIVVDEKSNPTLLPAKDNTWYVSNDSKTVFVFVHGILSNSQSAWWNDKSGTYWPELVAKDPTFEAPSIFLAGYYTDVVSGQYNIRDAANDLFRRLNLPVPPVAGPVLEKRNILFIAHSMGGIVVRHMLVKHKEVFEKSKVGLFLVASPSVGSHDATRFRWLAEAVRNKMGIGLQWDHPFLTELDKDFKNLVYEKDIPCLKGIEAVENHLIFNIFFRLFRDEVLVEEESAGRYFGEPQRLANTDHFTAVKPDNLDHPTHALLQYFFKNDFLKKCEPDNGKPRLVLIVCNKEFTDQMVLGIIDTTGEECRIKGKNFPKNSKLCVAATTLDSNHFKIGTKFNKIEVNSDGDFQFSDSRILLTGMSYKIEIVRTDQNSDCRRNYPWTKDSNEFLWSQTFNVK